MSNASMSAEDEAHIFGDDENIIDLSSRRKPVTYTIHVCHHWDGKIELMIEDLDDDIRSDEAVMGALGVLVENYRMREQIEYIKANMPPDMVE